jgi:transcriptional regulator of nitric oxide reductase
MKERNPLNEQEEGVAYETPVTIEIVSSAENTYLLHNELKDILVDASRCCEYMGYVDQNGDMRVKIECIVTEQEKQHSWDQLCIKPLVICHTKF